MYMGASSFVNIGSYSNFSQHISHRFGSSHCVVLLLLLESHFALCKSVYVCVFVCVYACTILVCLHMYVYAAFELWGAVFVVRYGASGHALNENPRKCTHATFIAYRALLAGGYGKALKMLYTLIFSVIWLRFMYELWMEATTKNVSKLLFAIKHKVASKGILAFLNLTLTYSK